MPEKEVDIKIDKEEKEVELEKNPLEKLQEETKAEPVTEEPVKEESEPVVKTAQELAVSGVMSKPAPKGTKKPIPAKNNGKDDRTNYDLKPPTKTRNTDVTVFLGCSQIAGNLRNTITLDAYFELKAAEMAKASGVDSYYDLEVYSRRESFARASKAIIEELAGYNVNVTVTTPDTLFLYHAIVSDPKVRVISK